MSGVKNTLDTPPVSTDKHADGDRWLAIFSVFIHDLESPIASVKYLLKLLDEGRFDPNKDVHRRLISSSRIAVSRAESIIYDILAVARAGSAGIPVSLSNLSPEPLIRDAIELASASAAENDVSISFDYNLGDTEVVADPSLLGRTIDNLLYNAQRHTPSGGKIEVYTEAGEQCVFIHIKDSGEGLGDIDTEILFEKFGQAQLRLEGRHRGVGLGLYFCRLAAEGMGGTIIADDHPDGGAVFSIKLTRAEE